MPASGEVFHRSSYAMAMARQLLDPNPLQVGVRSGIFLSGIRRIGKSTYLREDLVPELEKTGAIVIYVDLWADTTKSPMKLVLDAVRQAFADLQSAQSSVLARLARIKGLNFGAVGFSFGFQLETLGQPNGATLAQAFVELSDQARTDIVLIVDEVQQAMSSSDGDALMLALKAARDAVNQRANRQGHFLFVGTGSHKSMVSEMATRRTQAFNGAMPVDFEPLGQDFVDWKLDQIRAIPAAVVPSNQVAFEGFECVGNRPEEFVRALVQLQEAVKHRHIDADTAFPVICDTLAQAAADVEIRSIESFGALAEAIFDRLARSDADRVTGVFSQEALLYYSERTHSSVDTAQVQNVADKLIGANHIAREGHGAYRVVDPFVRLSWLRRASLLSGEGLDEAVGMAKQQPRT